MKEKRLFGTNGVRGVIGIKMVPDLALKLGKAIGTAHPCKRIAVGRDARSSGHMLRDAVMAGIMSTGADVIDLRILPTPALQYYVKNGGAQLGVVITASHNPPQFNGIKCIYGDGTEMSRDHERPIEMSFFNEEFNLAPWKDAGNATRDGTASEEYVRGVIRDTDKEAVSERDLKIVIDCANGAGSDTGPALAENLGAGVVSLNCHMSGSFPGHPSEPTEENLSDLKMLTRETDADFGIAMDGDADRSVFFTEKGEFVTGDKILALLAGLAVERNGGGTVVTPVATSSLVEEVVKRAGGDVLYTKVGAPIVARKMMEVDAIFGGEENGGMIFPSFQHCRDAGRTLTAVMELLATRKSPLSELVDQLPKFHTTKLKAECPDESKATVMKRVKEHYAGEKVDDLDGVKIFLEDGWVLVRPSGTEPIIRVYGESRDAVTSKKMTENELKALKEIINE